MVPRFNCFTYFPRLRCFKHVLCKLLPFFGLLICKHRSVPWRSLILSEALLTADFGHVPVLSGLALRQSNQSVCAATCMDMQPWRVHAVTLSIPSWLCFSANMPPMHYQLRIHIANCGRGSGFSNVGQCTIQVEIGLYSTPRVRPRLRRLFHLTFRQQFQTTLKPI